MISGIFRNIVEVYKNRTFREKKPAATKEQFRLRLVAGQKMFGYNEADEIKRVGRFNGGFVYI